ncbi:MAG: hypothetical protein WCG52_08530 [bacterium]|jgi:hypothetical protein
MKIVFLTEVGGQPADLMKQAYHQPAQDGRHNRRNTQPFPKIILALLQKSMIRATANRPKLRLIPKAACFWY